jgi:omega-6 fatty acid desaturase (delta-12 desaturase)
MKMSKLMHWFTGNIGYHHIHHINSRIPFYKLPQVFQEMKELQQVGTTSLSPSDILRCLRLKAWDPETGKMVGLNEIYATA